MLKIRIRKNKYDINNKVAFYVYDEKYYILRKHSNFYRLYRLHDNFHQWSFYEDNIKQLIRNKRIIIMRDENKVQSKKQI